jgi:hypothetical protein
MKKSEFSFFPEEEPVEKDNLNTLIVLLILVFLVWTGSIVLHYYFSDFVKKSFNEISFTGISSLFSALAFAGIIFTILLQRKELQLQRKELRETRKVLAKTATAQEASARQFERQSNNMKMSAKLNAYNTLIENLNRTIDAMKPYSESSNRERRKKFIIERDNYISKVKEILNIKNG